MSDRNKSFRNHCDIDVTINTENNSVSVEVAYKPALLQAPLYFETHQYYYNDVVEELKRQGIAVDAPSHGRNAALDNTTAGSRHPYVSASYVFPIASRKVESQPKAVESEVESEPESLPLPPEPALVPKKVKTSKRRSRKKSASE